MDVYENWIPDTVLGNSAGATSSTYPWNIEDIDAHVVWGRGVGMNVFVLDTGIRITHNEFGGRAFAGVDMSSGSLVVCTPSDTACAADDHWRAGPKTTTTTTTTSQSAGKGLLFFGGGPRFFS